MRHKLETEYLAPTLRGHIRYFATSYSKCPDQEGRASILLDGKEIISGGYYRQWSQASNFPQDEKYDERMRREFPFIDDDALRLGVFDQRCFYAAFREFDSQSIEKSLGSENLLVRIFALLDRRVGKRRLLAMKENIDNEPEAFRTFYYIRTEAEGLIKNQEN